MSSSRKPGRLAALVSAIVLALSPIAHLAASTDFDPKFNPSLNITKSTGEIRIDGILDDAAWMGAGRADNFVERSPGENLRPDVATEAFITYDTDRLYVAFRCYDDPAAIRATMCQRDQFENDDAVAFLLDTYGNSAWAYEFFVNPYGVQKDHLWSNIIGDDPGFDMIWESAASITDSGYQVEIAIPFAGLRFPSSDSQIWRVDFWRDHPRKSLKQYSWAAYNHDDQCWVCQWGTLSGIADVKPGKGLEILPSMILSQEGNMVEPLGLNSPIAEGRGDADLSIGAKYSISSTATLEGSYNPDFSQIETDEAQIDINSTIALFYPERRPFFQEGSDIFLTLFNSIYTRAINDPQFAAKATARTGRFSLGAISAYDENTPYIIPLEERTVIVNTGKSAVNIFRGSRAFGEDNHVGLIVTDRRFDGRGHGTILSVDGDLKLSPTYGLVGQYIYSTSEEPLDSLSIEAFEGETFDSGKHTAALDGESYSGNGFITQFRRRARAWNFTLNYDQVDPSYRTQTGYDPWTNYRNFTAESRYNIYPSKGLFERLTPNASWENRWNYEGQRKWIRFIGGLEGSLRLAQTQFALYINRGEERWRGILFDKLWNVHFETSSLFTNNLGYELSAEYGRGVAIGSLQKGNQTFLAGGLLLKPVDRLIIEPSLDYAQSRDPETDEELFEQVIARTRIRFQFNRELSMRFVAQYNNRFDVWNIDPLITYRISPFSVFYAGSVHNLSKLRDDFDGRQGWKETSRQFFIKLQYLFRA